MLPSFTEKAEPDTEKALPDTVSVVTSRGPVMMSPVLSTLVLSVVFVIL